MPYKDQDRRRASCRDYYVANRSRILSRNRERYIARDAHKKSRDAAYSREWAASNPEKVRASKQRSKQRRREVAQAWVAANKERLREWQRRYREANRDSLREYDKARYRDGRHIWRTGAPGVTEAMWSALSTKSPSPSRKKKSK